MDKSIFVIDDDPGILEVLKIILEDKGYAVTTFKDGHNLHQAIVDNLPKLILLDIWMSGFDGRDIAKALRDDPKTKDIPIVMLSAHSNTGEIAESVDVNGFLQKPFDIDQLLKIVEQYV